MQDISKLESRLWEAADQLRANSKLTASEYSMPVLGLIFLRHAYNRYLKVNEQIEKNLPKRNGKTRKLKKEDFVQKSAIYLPEQAQYDYLLNLSESEDIATKINEAMSMIESDYVSLQGALPKNYNIFEDALLRDLLRIFNDEALRNAKGDVFGRIYEYFLNKFAMTGAQEGGEFFTPVSLVQMIVNVIEPDHGLVCDIACGSAGMFVQTGHFLEEKGEIPTKKVTFKGQEKADLNIKLARMNLAVHGLEGQIVQGNTFYEDNLDVAGECDFIMANPPFNVDSVNAENTSNAGRLPFGLPGVNNKKAVSNGNYLWMQYFYSYLNDAGRAGFVMASSASDAGNKEKDIRQQLIETGHVDAIISIGTNFFYTRSLPCTLWFFDKGKPENRKDKVLMIDARNIYHKLTRKINIFTPEQLKNLTAITWLYRGQSDRFISLLNSYLLTIKDETAEIIKHADKFNSEFSVLTPYIDDLHESLKKDKSTDPEIKTAIAEYNLLTEQLVKIKGQYDVQLAELFKAIKKWQTTISSDNKSVKKCSSSGKAFNSADKILKSLIKTVHHLQKQTQQTIDFSEKKLKARKESFWDSRKIRKSIKKLEEQQKKLIEQLKKPSYFHKKLNWLLERFPKAEFNNIEGLCKLVDIDEIKENDYSLTPGRYVGVAPRVEDEDFDLSERLEEIHSELAQLNTEAAELSQLIQSNYEELDV